MAHCRRCGKEYGNLEAALGESLCDACSNEKERAIQEIQARPRIEPRVLLPRGRYPALRALVAGYRILACVLGIGFLAITFIGLSSSHILTWGWALGSLLGAFSCLAVGEIIKVFLDIEENTRGIHEALLEALEKKD
jgi:hypothetical protein